MGFHKIGSSSSLYQRGNVVVAICVDDILAGGPKEEVWKAISGIGSVVDTNPPEIVDQFLAMRFGKIQQKGDKRWIPIDQSDYAHMIVEDHKKEIQETCDLRMVSTPYIEETIQEGDLEVGKHVGTCRKHVGQLMFLMRCTRGDIAFAVGVLARHVSKWTRVDDRRLRRIY